MEEKNNNKFKISYLLVLVLAILLICLFFVDTTNPGTRIANSDFAQIVAGTYDDPSTEEVETLKAEKVYFKNGYVYILIENSKNAKKFPSSSDYYFEYTTGEELYAYEQQLDGTGIEFEVANVRTSWIQEYLPMIIFMLITFGALFFIIRAMAGSNKSAMTFGKSKGRLTNATKVKFDDIAGADEEKAELQEIVEFLKNPKKFTALGARIPKGVLLVGQPGTGKTLLAKAVAGESNVPFISISGSDFVEMFVGVGASRVRDLFDQAKKSKPCIVFIDEIDAVGRQRGAGLGGGNDEREQTLNQLLVEMDGFEPNEGIIVLAATNRSDVLDPALLRPGRFDRQIYVHVPDVRGREGIIKIHARNKPLDESVDFKTLARITTGFTGADIENMLNESAILAARAGRPKITMTDITEGINKVLMGPQKKSALVTPEDRKLTAYHESGHAILGKLLKNCEEVQEVSIIPRGMAGGYTLSRPENDNSYTSYGKLMDQIAMSMGGRIAEELIMGDITTGASSDIQHATSIAHKMVFDWGMSSKLGFMSLDSNSQVFIGRDYQTRNAFSEKIVADADDEVRTILAQNYKRAKAILTDNMKLLHEMAGLLLERETIYKEEVDMLVEGKTKEEIIKILSEREKAQKEKELKIIESNKKQAEIDALRKKILEGERLLAANVISKEEYEMLVQDLQAREEALKKEKEEQKNTQETKKETAELAENKEEKSEEKKIRRIKKSKDEGDTNE